MAVFGLQDVQNLVFVTINSVFGRNQTILEDIWTDFSCPQGSNRLIWRYSDRQASKVWCGPARWICGPVCYPRTVSAPVVLNEKKLYIEELRIKSTHNSFYSTFYLYPLPTPSFLFLFTFFITLSCSFSLSFHLSFSSPL